MQRLNSFFLVVCFLISSALSAQSTYWQQSVKYTMNVDVDTFTNVMKGTQQLEYTNNSPDTLRKVFYHLYWNAFQPNSSMDVRSRELGKVMVNGRQDWDGRVRDRILNLKENEIGYQKIKSFKMNGVTQSFIYHETILEVQLSKPIAPKSKAVFNLEFEAQVPLQVRRSGRDNPLTGVRYSMSQWYPKICAYDREGWHPTPYVAREFYGEWGDFDVTIRIDQSYKIGATGVLMNANEIGWGYDKQGTELVPVNKEKRSWHFVAKNVHDFVWAADPDYKHIVRKVKNGPTLHVIYNYMQGVTNDTPWTKVADAAEKALPYIEKHFGKYPYPQYSFIQGGDGGMEYPMATLISGPSLGTVFHEWMHSWYQMMMGTNEGKYSWMDEGFTSYGEDEVSKFYNNKSSLDEFRDMLKTNPTNENLKALIEKVPEDHASAYAGYYNLDKSGFAEPMCTHADHYNSNYGYSINSYSKGEVFLAQLGYIIGDAKRDETLLRYYDKWKYKHPDPVDFLRVAEQVSGFKLDWYLEYWVHSTRNIDYAIDSVWQEGSEVLVRLKRKGLMPMPVDVNIQYADGRTELHNIPLNLMYGNKQAESDSIKQINEPEWYWTHPTYTLRIKSTLSDITSIQIDATKRMADVNRSDNVYAK
jgi:hypothetical protein